jgi:hypothetical protein
MRVLERLWVLSVWFGGKLDPEAGDGATLCEWCNEQLGPDGCDRCAELYARTVAFYEE